MQGSTAAALVISIGGLWSTSCGTMAQPLPPPDAPPAPPPEEQIVAYTWEPVTVAADRLVYAIRVDRKKHDVQRLAAQLRARPPGRRVIRLWGWAARDLTRHPADRCRRPDGRPTEYWYPQPSAGLELVRARWRIFLAELQRAGAPLDEVILDFEASYGMWAPMRGEDKAAHLAAIQADPRFQGVVSTDAEDLHDLSRVHDYRHYNDYLTWNAAMNRVVDSALQASIGEPLRAFYPNVRCSNYTSRRVRKDLAVPSKHGGHRQWLESDGFGTHDAIAAYGEVGAVKDELLRDGEPLGDTPYAGLLFTIKRVESTSNSSTRPLKVWVAPKGKPLPMPAPFKGTPYHDELLRHLIVRRHGLILWNGRFGGDDEQMMHTSAILTECAERIGETGPSLAHSTAWSAAIIQSMTNHGDLVVHRFTLEHPRAGLRYRVNGVEHQRFPEAGEVGLWVTHARGEEFHVVQ
jgi:hypothetical protein